MEKSYQGCNVSCHITLQKSNNAASIHKWVNNYIFATTFTPANHTTPSFWKPGDTRLASCDTDSSLDDSTAFPTEPRMDLYDALPVSKLISIREFQ